MVHIRCLFSGLVAGGQLSFLTSSPDSIFRVQAIDPAARCSRQAGQSIIAFA
jgi:hypothetical protein